MSRTRRELLGAGALLAVGVAGCTQDSSGNGSGGNDDGASGAATVTVESHPEYGDLLADGEGRTLYMFTEDSQGAEESSCTGGCGDTWPALTAGDGVEAGDDVGAELDSFERADGDTQVTADGWPLYRYSGDESAGDANGQGVGGTWYVLGPDGSPKRESDGETPTDGGGGSDDDDGVSY